MPFLKYEVRLQVKMYITHDLSNNNGRKFFSNIDTGNNTDQLTVQICKSHI